jgi:hypothetical protein
MIAELVRLVMAARDLEVYARQGRAVARAWVPATEVRRRERLALKARARAEAFAFRLDLAEGDLLDAERMAEAILARRADEERARRRVGHYHYERAQALVNRALDEARCAEAGQ